MKKYEVKVIHAGYSEWIGPAQQKADGTITLVKGPKNLIFDTGIPKDKETIFAFLQNEGLSPKDIHFVICSHGHSDHIGNNNVFPDATFIVSYDVCKHDIYTFHNFKSGVPYKIDDKVEAISTPGHTSQDISLIVKTESGVIAIVGDLFESEKDLENEDLWKSFSENPEIHKKNREIILDMADYIVPGHGDMFRVPNE